MEINGFYVIFAFFFNEKLLKVAKLNFIKFFKSDLLYLISIHRIIENWPIGRRTDVQRKCQNLLANSNRNLGVHRQLDDVHEIAGHGHISGNVDANDCGQGVENALAYLFNG